MAQQVTCFQLGFDLLNVEYLTIILRGRAGYEIAAFNQLLGLSLYRGSLTLISSYSIPVTL